MRALGWRKGVLTVVDATAGLGVDSAALAKVGFSVIAMERAPVLVEMWRKAIAVGPRNLAFLEGDARTLLLELAAAGLLPDAVYLDPMYPADDKRTAAQQKGMVELRALVGDDDDAAELLDIARKVAQVRVVVKRPRRAKPLRDNVSHAWEGSSTRYDMYLL